MRIKTLPLILSVLLSSSIYGKEARDASSFGFMPGNSPAENTASLQKAVSGGGIVNILVPGTYEIDGTVLLPSDTNLNFGPGVEISLTSDNRLFLNEGAQSRVFNENISIHGLNLKANGHNVSSSITGLRGYIAFFYVRNLTIDKFTLLDGAAGPYVIHVCAFENVSISGCHIEGKKDAIHLGRGRHFVIRDCLFKTYDDPIALNAHDYTSGQPEYGWIEDGLIKNCYDLADPERGTSGYFARILAGAWVDWFEGMEVQGTGDTCVSEGRLYKTNGKRGDMFISKERPTHTSGTKVYSDGVRWTMMQDKGVDYSCGCRNIRFKDIHLQKPRWVAFSIHFDRDSFSRSYYPGAVAPVQKNLTFKNIFVENRTGTLISAITPVDKIRIISSDLNNDVVKLTRLKTEGIEYGKTSIRMRGNRFNVSGRSVIASSDGRAADLSIRRSTVTSDRFEPVAEGVKVLSDDLGTKQESK